MSTQRNEYLDAGSSDSDHEDGYDSETAEYSKDRIKRRKLSSSPIDNVVEAAELNIEDENEPRNIPSLIPSGGEQRPSSLAELSPKEPIPSTKPLKAAKPGVIYLSSLPPYLKPSALRNLLTQRGFSPITRLFLAPSSKAKNHHSAKKSSRQLYTEGWIEFASKKMAKRCAETLNATTVGGRKGGFYHDDIWNMKYLRGVGWDDLMAQVREERREEEVRRTDERGQIARETKEFLEGVERGKMTQGIETSREKKRKKAGFEGGKISPDESSERRSWRQYKVKGGGSGGERGDSAVSEDVKRVLSKIF
jgi:ESF2/ABP1 family protein